MGWPTTDEPRDNFLSLRLTDAEQAEVDAYVKRRGEKRSTSAREALMAHIRADAAAHQNPAQNPAQKPVQKTPKKPGKGRAW